MRQSQLSPLEGPGDDRIFSEDGSVSGSESEGEGNGSRMKKKQQQSRDGITTVGLPDKVND
ncbi:hypothetical protein E2C01_012928 [Portunus trituberculatus]|uniref:Uncharacterized protein n=1 Tax=Portunus trituberculatus TaxID=210409 RepID=A0A5B7DFB2_PORTR|nr:hypothetical protein [Portunus trituberculatus]